MAGPTLLGTGFTAYDEGAADPATMTLFFNHGVVGDVAGDYLVVYVFGSSIATIGDAIIDGPDGWTSIYQDQQQGVMIRQEIVGEPNSYIFSTGGGNGIFGAIMCAVHMGTQTLVGWDATLADNNVKPNSGLGHGTGPYSDGTVAWLAGAGPYSTHAGDLTIALCFTGVYGFGQDGGSPISAYAFPIPTATITPASPQTTELLGGDTGFSEPGVLNVTPGNTFILDAFVVQNAAGTAGFDATGVAPASSQGWMIDPEDGSNNSLADHSWATPIWGGVRVIPKFGVVVTNIPEISGGPVNPRIVWHELPHRLHTGMLEEPKPTHSHPDSGRIVRR